MGQQDSQKQLLVFISHASEDHAAAGRLAKRLKEDGFDPWRYEDRLLPGQDWDLEIEKALRASDVILLCFSTVSVNKAGYIQREYKRALRIQEEKPEGAIFTIPVRLDECDVPFSFREIQWVDYPDGYDKLRQSLQMRSGGIPMPKEPKEPKKNKPAAPRRSSGNVINVQGGFHVNGSFINGPQTNYITNQTINNISSSAEFVSELQKLKAEIEALKATVEPAAARRLAAVEGDVQDVIEESQKEKPAPEKIKTTLDGAKEMMEKLGGSVTAAVGLGTTLGNLALMALKLFGK